MTPLHSVKTALIGAVFFCAIGTAANASDPACIELRSASFVAHRCDEDRLWVVETTRPIVARYYSSKSPTLRQLSTREPSIALWVNASYHDGDYASARLEGLFVVHGKQIAPLKPGDAQLSHIVNISSQGRIIAVEEAPNANSSITSPPSSKRGDTRIQTGPLILDRGEIASQFIAASLNGADAYKRTAIGVTAGGATVFVVARTPRSLDQLARAVLDVSNYRERKLSLVNLDGGPSTALHSTEQRGLSYQADKLTPVMFGVQR
jgi:uncharacterized protein YigE (DUF2233 family)